MHRASACKSKPAKRMDVVKFEILLSRQLMPAAGETPGVSGSGRSNWERLAERADINPTKNYAP